MAARIGVITVVVASLIVGACRTSRQDRSSVTSRDRSPLTPEERSTVTQLLQCEECSDGELVAVTNLAARKPAVVDTLSEDLLRGPSRESRSRLRRQFLQTYREDSLFQNSSPEGLRPSGHSVALPAVIEPSGEFVDHYLGNYVALYRVRAATALARIGGNKARAALDSALTGHLRLPNDTLRSDVKAAIQLARDRVLAPGGP
jgi:hypothetical protein